MRRLTTAKTSLVLNILRVQHTAHPVIHQWLTAYRRPTPLMNRSCCVSQPFLVLLTFVWVERAKRSKRQKPIWKA